MFNSANVYSVSGQLSSFYTKKTKKIPTALLVTDFLKDAASSSKYKLSLAHKMTMTILASHDGRRGIYPRLQTLAMELGRSSRSVIRDLKYLEQVGLISIIRRFGTSNRYVITLPEVSKRSRNNLINNYTNHVIIPQDQTPDYITATNPISHSTMPERLEVGVVTSDVMGVVTSGCHTNSSYQILKKREEPKPKLANPNRKHSHSLFDVNFLFNEETKQLLSQTALRVGISEDVLMKKFTNVQKSTRSRSYDWNAKLQNFLLSERCVQKIEKTGRSNKPSTDHIYSHLENITEKKLSVKNTEPKDVVPAVVVPQSEQYQTLEDETAKLIKQRREERERWIEKNRPAVVQNIESDSKMPTKEDVLRMLREKKRIMDEERTARFQALEDNHLNNANSEQDKRSIFREQPVELASLLRSIPKIE